MALYQQHGDPEMLHWRGLTERVAHLLTSLAAVSIDSSIASSLSPAHSSAAIALPLYMHSFSAT